MLRIPRAAFTRRPNRDGTTESFCNRCFVTVASAHFESDLERAEQAHVCDPHTLAYWQAVLDQPVQETRSAMTAPSSRPNVEHQYPAAAFGSPCLNGDGEVSRILNGVG